MLSPKSCLHETTGSKDNHLDLNCELSLSLHCQLPCLWEQCWSPLSAQDALTHTHTKFWDSWQRHGAAVPTQTNVHPFCFVGIVTTGANSAGSTGHSLLSVSCWKMSSCSSSINSNSWLDSLTWKRWKGAAQCEPTCFQDQDQTP